MSIAEAKVVPLILSGGMGTRLWPSSRTSYPKQFLPLAHPTLSLLQQTVQRVRTPLFTDPVIICNEEHRFLVSEQLEAIGVKPACILLEPVGRNTAPAIGIGALKAEELFGPNAVVAVFPSDHFIPESPLFGETVLEAYKAAEKDYLVTFGIPPIRPETGYGYIQTTKSETISDTKAHKIARFVEKPNHQTALEYLASGDYVWNSGMFCFRAMVYMAELATYAPDIHAAVTQSCERQRQDLAFTRIAEPAFHLCRSDSIDYAIMEKTRRGVVLPMTLPWSDVGSWEALYDLSEKDADNNHLNGDVVALETTGSFIRSEQGIMVATYGVKDMIVVANKDAVLVVPKELSQGVKHITEALKQSGRTQYAHHERIYRPWGWYETLDLGERFQVKHLMVNPKASLSLQMHHHRAEHWVVVKGTAKVTCDDKVLLMSENESTYIPVGSKHRLENPGKIPLSVIEIQSGGYLGEDDIVRFEDVYQR